MALPDNLERLRQISIDTLGLSESTSAFLKWYGITSILDCIAVFHGTVYKRDAGELWPRFFRLLFGEVKTQLIAAGYWQMISDSEMWRALDEHHEDIYLQRSKRRVAHWQGRDQDLYELAIEQLEVPKPPAGASLYFTSIGECIDHFQYLLKSFSDYWLQIGIDLDSTDAESLSVNEYIFGLVQPRLVVLGYWTFVEDYLDDVAEEAWS